MTMTTINSIPITGGGSIQLYRNDRGPVAKTETIMRLIPDKITECAFSARETCFDERGLDALRKKFQTDSIEKIKEVTGCESQKCIATKLPREIAVDQLRKRFKLPGPTGVQLLSNFNIDAILIQMETMFPEFFSFGFSMKNGSQYSYECEPNAHGENVLACDVFARPDKTNRVELAKIHAAGKRYAGTVINTDVYQRGGKHWMAMFIDMNTNRVEFFNSSGNAPCAEIINWMAARCEEMPGSPGTIARVCKFRHQHSRTECGVYSLFYIYARLSGVPAEYFMSEPIPDQLMMEFRQHLFDATGDPGASTIDISLAEQYKLPTSKFSFDEFARRINIQWE